MSTISKIVNRAPVPYVSRAEAAARPFFSFGRNARTQQLSSMDAAGTIFSIVDKLSTGCAEATWRLYRTADNRGRIAGDAPRREVPSHALLDLWNRPNPFFPQDTFVEASQQHHELTGEMWWILYRSEFSPMPLEMWPVRPDRMEPVPSTTQFLAGYMYTSPDGERIPLRTDEVIFTRRPSPLDIYRGIGVVGSIMMDLESSRLSSEWMRNFFYNSAEPGGIIQVEKRLSDEEFDEMTRRWNEQHKGVSRAHRVAVVEQGQWVDRKYTMRDMQFAELAKVTSEQIREAFGFPKPMLGSVEDVNRANADAGATMFARWMVRPRLSRIRTALNTYLIPMFGESARGLHFDFDDPVPEDSEIENSSRTSKAEAAKNLVDAGYDHDDVLETVGLPPMGHTEPQPRPDNEPNAPNGGDGDDEDDDR